MSNENTTTRCVVHICRLPQADGQKRELQLQIAQSIIVDMHKQLFGQMPNLQRQENRWVSDKGVSVSHSGEYLAVAVADTDVGVDLQKCTDANMHKIASKFFTQKEQLAIQNSANTTDSLFFTWCKKEALWKKLKTQPPTIAGVETTKQPFTLQKLTLGNETYYLAVTGDASVTIKEDLS